MIQSQLSPSKIGYLWQYETADLTSITATALHVRAVMQSFEQRGHTLRLVTFHQGQPSWTADRLHWNEITDVALRPRLLSTIERPLRGIQARLHLPFVRFFDSVRFADAVEQAAKGCDFLYERFWLLGYGGLIASKRLGIPLIYEVNGDLVSEYAQLGIQLSKAQWAAIHLVTHLMFRYVDHIVTVSDDLRQRTIQRWRVDPAKVTAIPNGAHVDMFTAPPIQSAADRHSVAGAPTIAFVGSFKPWHGLDLLIDAFARVASQIPACKLLLVGDGPVRAALEEKIGDMDLAQRVIFTGKVAHSEVAALLQSAQIAVVNPRVSNASMAQSPLKLFEYMAAGKAIVAPAIPTVERILTDEKTGLLVPPDDVDALSTALLRLLRDDLLCRRLGQAAKEQAVDNHSWDRTTAAIEAHMSRLRPRPTLVQQSN